MIDGGPGWPSCLIIRAGRMWRPHETATPWSEILAQADAVCPLRDEKPPQGWTHVFTAVWDRVEHHYALRLPDVRPGQRARIVADRPPPRMSDCLGLVGTIEGPATDERPYHWFCVDSGQPARLTRFVVRLDELIFLDRQRPS